MYALQVLGSPGKGGIINVLLPLFAVYYTCTLQHWWLQLAIYRLHSLPCVLGPMVPSPVILVGGKVPGCMCGLVYVLSQHFTCGCIYNQVEKCE